MSFGFSVGDVVLLAQLAKTTFRNCQKAGDEYVEIAQEVCSLRSVVRALRSEAQRPDSGIFSRDVSGRRDLIEAVDGCKKVLDDLASMLSKYEGLGPVGTAGRSKRLWQRFRFGSKIEELAAIRGKLITYTSTISVLLDTMQLKASNRIEQKVDDGFTEVLGNFESMRKEILTIAVHERARQRVGSTSSVLSLSTCAGDDPLVWKEFRRELIHKGFRSNSLEKYRDILQAYMLRLHESSVLDDHLEESTEDEQEIDGAAQTAAGPGSTIHRTLKEKDIKGIEDYHSTGITNTQAQSCAGKPVWDGEEEFYAMAQKWRSGRISARDPLESPNPLSFEDWFLNRKISILPIVTFAPSPVTPLTPQKKRSQAHPLRGILRKPTLQFPEDLSPVMDGSAPRVCSGQDGVPFDRRMTRLSKKRVGPEILELGRIRYEVTDEHIIILELLIEKEVERLIETTSYIRNLRSIGVYSTILTCVNIVQASGLGFRRYQIWDTCYSYSATRLSTLTPHAIVRSYYGKTKKDYILQFSSSFTADIKRHIEQIRGIINPVNPLCSSVECCCSFWRYFSGKIHTFSTSNRARLPKNPESYLRYLRSLEKASQPFSSFLLSIVCNGTLVGEYVLSTKSYVDLPTLDGFRLFCSFFEDYMPQPGCTIGFPVKKSQ